MNVATLVPTKSDADVAAELKQRIVEAYAPILKIMDDARNAGFDIAVGAGQGPLGVSVIQQLKIMKAY